MVQAFLEIMNRETINWHIFQFRPEKDKGKGHVDRKVPNDRYTQNRPKHRAAFYQQSFFNGRDISNH